jgi:hypothetical protein
MPSDKEIIACSLFSGEPDKGRIHHHSDLPDADRIGQHGSIALTIANPIEAGSQADVRFTITIGETSLTTDAALRLAWRWPFDWADLQQTDPSAPNYLSAKFPDGVTADLLYEHRGNLNPWHHDIDIRITSGTLKSGDTIEVSCTRWDAPTFATEDGYFLIAISPDGSDHWIRLVDPRRFTIAPGVADRLIAISPADGYIGEQATIRVRAIDAWENATPIDPPHLKCTGATIQQPAPCPRFPVWEYPVEWTSTGVHRIHVLGDGLSCVSNPTRVTEKEPERRTYWGDLHAGQSEIGCGAGSLDHHYAYARDVAAMQFASQQANDHYITKALWEHVRQVTPRHNVEGEFLAYLGCEWSPYTEDGGDRNVIYMTDEPRMRRSDRFFKEHDPDPEPDLNRAPEFLDVFREEDVLLNLHVGGRPTNLEWHAPEIEPLFEIHSTHATSEWFYFDALRRGYKVGVTAGTDGVMGRPGACGSGRRVTRNVRNGLTAVSATSLTQRAVADGFFARHCYGTTGARILLDVSIDGSPMGSEIAVTRAPRIQIVCEGTAGIERIDLFRDTELIESRTLADPDPSRYRILYGGSKEEGTAAAQRQHWDGTMRIGNGTLGDIKPVGLQCPLNQIMQNGETVNWALATAGNDMGFTFTLEGDASLDVSTDPCSFSCTRSELDAEYKTVDAGGLQRRIEIGHAPSDETPLSVSESFVDENPLDGEHAYWVRITQTDRHRAWSSPIYLTI